MTINTAPDYTCAEFGCDNPGDGFCQQCGEPTCGQHIADRDDYICESCVMAAEAAEKLIET